MSEKDAYYQLITCYRFSSMESFSLVKVLVLCKRLVNLSQTTLVMYIHSFTNSQDATEIDATYNYHQVLMPSVINHKNATKTEMKPHKH